MDGWLDFRKATKGIFTKANGRTIRDQAAAYRHLRAGAGRIPRPAVSDAKLKNLVADLYKGDRMPQILGTGSTADAARLEYALGGAFKFRGKDHLKNKAPQYTAALKNWLARYGATVSASDRAAAASILRDLQNAIGGH